MELHRKILGWLFCSMALLLVLFVGVYSKSIPDAKMTADVQTLFMFTLVAALIYAAAGLSLLLKFRYAAWICLPLGVLSLFSFPLGTVIGGYYLWYFWKFVYKRPN